MFMFKTLLASTFLLFNVGANVPKHNVSTFNGLYGAYNFRDDFVFTDLIDDYGNTSQSFTYDFDVESTPSYNVTVQVGTYTYFLDTFTFTYRLVGTSLVYITVDFTYYTDMLSYNTSSTFSIASGGTLNDVPSNYRSLIIYFDTSWYVDDHFDVFFNKVFTTDDNALTVTKNGYYSFVSNNVNTNISWYGVFTYDNNLYTVFTDTIDGSLSFRYYDYTRIYYLFKSIPNNSSPKNIILSGCKMTKETETRLNGFGVFQYIRDSQYDNTDFSDLLFAVVDSPIRMLTDLFSFELLGVQFYVAFMSIVTLLIICFVLRKLI